jgi:hypothetical protein
MTTLHTVIRYKQWVTLLRNRRTQWILNAKYSLWRKWHFPVINFYIVFTNKHWNTVETWDICLDSKIWNILERCLVFELFKVWGFFRWDLPRTVRWAHLTERKLLYSVKVSVYSCCFRNGCFICRSRLHVHCVTTRVYPKFSGLSHKEINKNNNNKLLLRRNTKCYGGKTH